VGFGAGTLGLSFAAGILSTLSPCVLPLVPIVVASAAAAHRLGAVALTLGLILSYTGLGMLLATVGASLGIDQSWIRGGAALILIALGVILLSSRLQQRFATSTSGIGSAGEGLLNRIRLDGWWGQFAVGLLLGIVWSPCVGPTLGAATVLASQGQNLTHVSLVMVMFGLGAGAPLILLGLLSRASMNRMRGALMATGKWGKSALGCTMVALGIVILAGWDKLLETWVLEISPAWLTDLTTRF
jgi:cytochrome c-type biogenesis protein